MKYILGSRLYKIQIWNWSTTYKKSRSWLFPWQYWQMTWGIWSSQPILHFGLVYKLSNKDHIISAVVTKIMYVGYYRILTQIRKLSLNIHFSLCHIQGVGGWFVDINEKELTLGADGGLPEMGLHVWSPDPPDMERVRNFGRSYSSIDIERRRAAFWTCCMGTEETERHQEKGLKW